MWSIPRSLWLKQAPRCNEAMIQPNNTLINEWWTCEITQDRFTTLHLLNTYSNVWQFRTFYYCFNDCCNLIVSAYTTFSAPVLWAWIFLSFTKCCSYIIRMVSLTFSECKITTSGLHPNAILSIVYVLNRISTNFITYIIMSAAEIYCFHSVTCPKYIWIRMETWQRQLWYASKVPNKMLYLRGTP